MLICILKKNHLFMNILKNKKIKTNIVYGIYDSPEDAKLSASKNMKGKEDNAYTIKKAGTVQQEFKDFSTLKARQCQ